MPQAQEILRVKSDKEDVARVVEVLVNSENYEKFGDITISPHCVNSAFR